MWDDGRLRGVIKRLHFFRHPEPCDCHPGPIDCHPVPNDFHLAAIACHPGLDPGSSQKNSYQLFFSGPRIKCGVTVGCAG